MYLEHSKETRAPYLSALINELRAHVSTKAASPPSTLVSQALARLPAPLTPRPRALGAPGIDEQGVAAHAEDSPRNVHVRIRARLKVRSNQASPQT